MPITRKGKQSIVKEQISITRKGKQSNSKIENADYKKG